VCQLLSKGRGLGCFGRDDLAEELGVVVRSGLAPGEFNFLRTRLQELSPNWCDVDDTVKFDRPQLSSRVLNSAQRRIAKVARGKGVSGQGGAEGHLDRWCPEAWHRRRGWGVALQSAHGRLRATPHEAFSPGCPQRRRRGKPSWSE
jgi:hypothetical protein